MNKTAVMIAAMAAGLSMTACQPSSTQAEQTTAVTTVESNTQTETAEQNTTGQDTAEQNTENRSLVAYFSYGENAELPEGVDASSSASIQFWNGETTGNTGLIAHMIEDYTGADIFSIQTVVPYPDTYDATIEQGQAENNAGARPELANSIENLEDYDTIFLGFPNWWYNMPMAMYSFLDEYDLSGKTVVVFCTSGGSGFSSSVNTIREMEPGAEVVEGISIGASDASGAQQQVEQWLSGLEY